MASLPFPAEWVAEDSFTGEIWVANPAWTPSPPDGTEESEAQRAAIEALDMACPHGNWSRGSTHLDRAEELCAHLRTIGAATFPTLLGMLEGRDDLTSPQVAAMAIPELDAFVGLQGVDMAPAVVRVDTGEILLDPLPPGRHEEVLFSLFPSDGKYVVLDGDALVLRRYFFRRELHHIRSRDIWLRKRHTEELFRGLELHEPWHMRVELRPNLPFAKVARNLKSLLEDAVAFGNPIVW